MVVLVMPSFPNCKFPQGMGSICPVHCLPPPPHPHPPQHLPDARVCDRMGNRHSLRWTGPGSAHRFLSDARFCFRARSHEVLREPAGGRRDGRITERPAATERWFPGGGSSGRLCHPPLPLPRPRHFGGRRDAVCAPGPSGASWYFFLYLPRS